MRVYEEERLSEDSGCTCAGDSDWLVGCFAPGPPGKVIALQLGVNL